MTEGGWQPMDDQMRTRRLAHAVAVISQTARIESQGPFNATLVSGSRPNHVLHAILTISTCLLWGVVWLVVGLSVRESRIAVMVDDYGRVYTSSNAGGWIHAPALEQ